MTPDQRAAIAANDAIFGEQIDRVVAMHKENDATFSWVLDKAAHQFGAARASATMEEARRNRDAQRAAIEADNAAEDVRVAA